MFTSSTRHPFPPFLTAQGVSRGIALGKVWLLSPKKPRVASETGKGAEVESTRFKNAQSQVLKNIDAMVEKARKEVGAHEAEIFEAHSMMLQDEELTTPILTAIATENKSAESAIEQSFAMQIEIFQASDSDYMKERALDLKDLKTQLLDALSGEGSTFHTLQSPVILVAEDLTPSQTISLDRKNILGIITEKGGETSHTAIIARTLGIPAITGVREDLEKLSSYEQVAIDGEEGSLFVVDDPKVESYFLKRVEGEVEARKLLDAFRGKPSQTRDGYKIKLFGNIGSSEEAKSVVQSDGEGVGLFRTEFLFMQRNQPPTLEEQRIAYEAALEALAPNEVVIRTLDVGGDKEIPYLNIPKEENPFLGVRALRYCLQDLPLFKTQIKALLLANTKGNLSIMLPMVSRASEVRDAAKIIEECRSELKGTPNFKDQPFKLGAMVEIPSLAFEQKELAKYVSFISVGTNDLLQYSVAVDRMNPTLQPLYCPYNLGFLRIMLAISQNAKAAGLEMGICGELGGAQDFLPLWVAMGFQKLSMVPGEILSRRAELSKTTHSACVALLNEVLDSEDETKVELLLQSFVNRGE